MNTQNISVTILTRNSEKYISQVLEAVRDFGEVLIYDSGSQDQTMQIAASYSNTKIVEGDFKGFGPTHNKASKSARNDWILSIDSDEVVSKELIDEINHLALDSSTVYSISRKNIYRGKWITSCGWSPDRQKKLYCRQKTRFTDAAVHESVISDGMKLIELKASIVHYPYETAEDFLRKMQSYSSLFAEQYKGKRKSSLGKAILRGAFTFLKCYLFQRGFLQGAEGFIISWYNANTTYFKYLKLAEKNKEIS